MCLIWLDVPARLVVMYLRETKQQNADSSTVNYLALAHNERTR
jgi:hypothetical protein